MPLLQRCSMSAVWIIPSLGWLIVPRYLILHIGFYPTIIVVSLLAAGFYYITNFSAKTISKKSTTTSSSSLSSSSIDSSCSSTYSAATSSPTTTSTTGQLRHQDYHSSSSSPQSSRPTNFFSVNTAASVTGASGSTSNRLLYRSFFNYFLSFYSFIFMKTNYLKSL